MWVRLKKHVHTSRDQFRAGSVQEVKYLGAHLWMRGLRDRPLNDDEWELVLDDGDLAREFPEVEK